MKFIFLLPRHFTFPSSRVWRVLMLSPASSSGVSTNGNLEKKTKQRLPNKLKQHVDQ